MSDLISREAVLELFATHDGNYLYEAIRDMPSAQPDVTDTNVGDTISRQAVLQRLTDIAYNYCKTEGQAQVIDWIKTLVCVMPSAQPDLEEAYICGETEAEARFHAEIIACGDCKHWICHDRRCGYWNHGVRAIDWCSYAERRTDEQ